MDKQEEILIKHWNKVTSRPFDESTKMHMKYVFDAMQEYSDKVNKKLLDRIAELEAENAQKMWPARTHASPILEEFFKKKPSDDNLFVGEWTNVNDKLPEIGGFYITTQDIDDGEPPLTWPLNFNVGQKKWFRDIDEKDEEFGVLAWMELPKPMNTNWKPELIIPPPITLDEFERNIYGQCPHGENMTNCVICNNI